VPGRIRPGAIVHRRGGLPRAASRKATGPQPSGPRAHAIARAPGARRGPHQREGRCRLRLAPRAAREDERGEGGPKSRNGSGLVGLTVGGGGTTTAAVKNTPGTAVTRSVAWTRGTKRKGRVTLSWLWAEESEGERDESAARRSDPFETEVGEGV
jgi:hypothetical protein